MRALFGSSDWFPPIRSAGGVIAVMVLAFYPYVYMLARAAFLAQGRRMLETGRVLGLSPRAAFLRVALPMARPALAAGVALALMEALADFGAVAIFNYDTFTTAIYKSWLGLFSLPAAAQLASLLLLFVAVALIGERQLRGRARYHAALRHGARAALPARRRARLGRHGRLRPGVAAGVHSFRWASCFTGRGRARASIWMRVTCGFSSIPSRSAPPPRS